MALSPEDRIAFSKKIVSAEAEKNSINASEIEIAKEKDKALKLDNANKNLVDGKTPFINAYQSELATFTGNTFTQLTEADIQNSANRTLGNFFFPNNVSALPPSLSAPWSKTKPFMKTIAVGLTNAEVSPGSTTAESVRTGDVISTINSIQLGYTNMQRTSGQVCSAGGVCSIPNYFNSSDCTSNGGVWTPGPDAILTYTALHNQLTTLISQVNALKSFLLAQKALIPAIDPVASRQTANDVARNDIDVVVGEIDTWLTYSNFNTAHGQTSCAGFNGYDFNLLGPTKLRPTELTSLKNKVIGRIGFQPTRQGQLSSFLGSITQNLNTGNITGSGLYYERALYLQLRLNLIGGSLTALKGFEQAQTAQGELKDNIDSTKAAYETLLKASILTAPTNGTAYIHVKDGTGYAVGDTVYLVSETQPELRLNIAEVSGNRIKVSVNVPAKYSPADTARLYKPL